jgi:hypothetical protein
VAARRRRAALVAAAFVSWTASGPRGSVRKTGPLPSAAPLDSGMPSPATTNVAPPARFPGSGARRVRAALDRQIAASGLAGRLTAEDRAALLAALADVRRVARPAAPAHARPSSSPATAARAVGPCGRS